MTKNHPSMPNIICKRRSEKKRDRAYILLYVYPVSGNHRRDLENKTTGHNVHDKLRIAKVKADSE